MARPNTFQPTPLLPLHVQEGSESIGFNAQAGRFEDLVAAGIIDPMKVGAVGGEWEESRLQSLPPFCPGSVRQCMA